MYVELSVRVTNAVDGLMAPAIATGELRGDIRPEDLLQAIFAFCYARQPEPGCLGAGFAFWTSSSMACGQFHEDLQTAGV